MNILEKHLNKFSIFDTLLVNKSMRKESKMINAKRLAAVRGKIKRLEFRLHELRQDEKTIQKSMMKEISLKIYHFMRQVSWDAKKLSEQSGVPEKEIRNIQNSTLLPCEAKRKAIANALHVEYNAIWPC